MSYQDIFASWTALLKLQGLAYFSPLSFAQKARRQIFKGRVENRKNKLDFYAKW